MILGNSIYRALTLLLLFCCCIACNSDKKDNQEETYISNNEILVQDLLDQAKYYKTRHSDSATYFSLMAIDSAEALSSAHNEAVALYHYGEILLYYNDLDSAYRVLTRSLPLFEQAVDQSPALNLLSTYYTEVERPEKSLECTQKVLQLTEEAGRHATTEAEKRLLQEYRAMAYHQTGFLYYRLGQKEYAKKYHHKGLALHQDLKDSSLIAYSYLKVCCVDDYAFNLNYIDSALTIIQRPKDLFLEARALNIKGHELVNQKRYEEALSYMDSARSIYLTTGNTQRLIFNTNGIALCYLEQGNFEACKTWCQKSIALQADSKNIRALDEAYRILSYAEAGLGNWQAAFETQHIVHEKLDEYLYKNISNLTANMEGKFQLSQKEQELKLKDQDLLQKEAANIRLFFLIVVVVLLSVIAILYFYFRQKIQKQRAEQELREQEKEAQRLEELNAIKSTFLANITHELRTPLTLLLSPLQSMLDGNLKGNQEEYLELMAKNGTQLENLINQLLNISRLEKNEWPTQIQTLELWSHFRYLCNSFESYAIRQEISFDQQIPDGQLYVDIDVQKLEQIVLNLLSNAFKYTDEAGKVVFTLRLEEQKIVFQIQDTGKGIPESDIPHLFDRFFRVEGQREGPAAGSGIGLALVKDLVNWFEGEIEVASKLGKGSTFRVTLPVLLVEAPQAAPSPELIDKGVQGEKPVLLVVEDHPDVLRLLSEQLSDDFVIEQASNGLEGLTKATALIPDLVITDVMMPVMDGREFCTQLKAQKETSHIPVLMLTALSQREEKLKGLTAAADHYLSKPFQIKELKLIIRNLLDMRSKMGAFLKEQGVLAISKTALPDMEKQFLDQLIQLIETNLDQENYTVNQLAKEAGLSRSQLHRKLVALTDQTPSQFMRKLRLQHAKNMLQNKTVTISEVAYACGFSSLSYFSRCFKEEFGQSPAQSR